VRAIHAGNIRRSPGAKHFPGFARLSVADGIHIGAHEGRQVHVCRTLLEAASALLAVDTREAERGPQSEISPLLVDVEGQTLKLTGSAEAQYTQWREMLREIFETETGLPLDGDASAATGSGTAGH